MPRAPQSVAMYGRKLDEGRVVVINAATIGEERRSTEYREQYAPSK